MGNVAYREESLKRTKVGADADPPMLGTGVPLGAFHLGVILKVDGDTKGNAVIRGGSKVRGIVRLGLGRGDDGVIKDSRLKPGSGGNAGFGNGGRGEGGGCRGGRDGTCDGGGLSFVGGVGGIRDTAC